VRGLRMLGAVVDFIVPNRFETGYGLSPDVVKLVEQHPRLGKPDWIITVDNGIASVDGVDAANAAGIRVLVTDHHLPGPHLPRAACIVNPNQPGCGFPSKHLAGVGVMFYVLLATRAELRVRGRFDETTQPRLDRLLDLVALGTVADVVRLDANNRRLVAQGIARMRSGQMQPGVAALFKVAGRNAATANTFDLGFALGPRINAAGRLADMSLGIACLLTDDGAEALRLAQQLDSINRERRDIEAEMQDVARLVIEQDGLGDRAGIVLYDAAWHQGVVGIVAGRIKERFWRPTIAFAPAVDAPTGGAMELRGSGRSIPGLHLRDALDLVAKRLPGVIRKFGGHAMAAGLTILDQHVELFGQTFEAVCREWLDEAALTRRLETDGPLPLQMMQPETADLIDAQVWGQGFAAPVFCDTFEVLNQRLLKDKHLKLALRKGNAGFDGIWFNHADSLPPRARIAYRLVHDRYMGASRLQLQIEHAEPV
ncbi:MAG TPA: DHHA1 domain-containing protein, partial [Burkholderiaceae bacterium]|nr:DHHA1 domain-containing protein [Burkholderiaceae bacterium]